MTVNIYGGGLLDRAGPLRRDADWLAAQATHPEARFTAFWRSQVAVLASDTAAAPLFYGPGDARRWCADGHPAYFLGLDGGDARFALDLSALAEPPSPPGSFVDLRSVGTILRQTDGAMLAFGRALIHWHQTNRFCGRCGAPTESRLGGHMRQCLSPTCAAEHFPRTDPAIIVLVTAGDHCLLGRQARWRPGMMSTLAGFVEPGETLEEAVTREVMEETGVAITSMRYHSSQPWPFPGNLMVGFAATAPTTAPVTIDPQELESAAWFSRAEVAAFDEQRLPNRDSIARRLIGDWLSGR
jgi:NAD+ diphosphatase